MSARLAPVLALDIGGTKLAVAMVTPDGRPHGLLIQPTRVAEGPDAVIDRLLGMGRAAVREAGLGAPAAVGISCGGPMDAAAGVLLSPLHLPGWHHVPLGDLVTAEFGAPSVLQNDASAAALGEYQFGVGQGVDTLVYLTVSTGIGGGIVLGGRLHRGAAGNGGELGHLVVRPGGRPCTCPRSGCIEAYASGTSIAARARERLAAGESSSLATRQQAVTAEDVSRAAAAGDALASSVWAETVELLAEAVTDLVNVFEPDLVLLGGGVTRAGAMLVDPIRSLVGANAMGPAARAARIELSALGEVVGVVGAGAVALDLLAARDQAADPSPDAPADPSPATGSGRTTGSPDQLEELHA